MIDPDFEIASAFLNRLDPEAESFTFQAILFPA
jgi:hypothetical protein